MMSTGFDRNIPNPYASFFKSPASSKRLSTVKHAGNYGEDGGQSPGKDRGSKGGLRNMFSRLKLDQDAANHLPPPHQEELSPQESSDGVSVSLATTDGDSSQSSRTSYIDSPSDLPSSNFTGYNKPVRLDRNSWLDNSSDPSHTHFIGYKPARTAERPARMADKTSRMSMRAISTKKKESFLHTKTRPSPAAKSLTPPIRPSTAWDPPPLFQALSQAIKHAQLSSSTLTADSIIRIHSSQKNGSIINDLAQMRPGTDEAKRSERARMKHSRQVSESILKAEWTSKIYVLVTSGYILQYSSEGQFDRLPEKMIQLGKDSVAFASDVIPGRHWVLQISQAIDANGTAPLPDTRSLRSRFTLRATDHHHHRRNATSFLLVLNSPEELESWLTIVRHEIEALGGKKCESETGGPVEDDQSNLSSLRPLTGQHDRFSPPLTPQDAGFENSWVHLTPNEHDHPTWALGEALHEPVVRPSEDAPSVATSFASQEEQLNSLRSSYRHSHMSSGTRTLITSRGSSPSTSPTNENFFIDDDTEPHAIPEIVQPRPNAAAISERRRSVQNYQTPATNLEVDAQSSRARPSSALGAPNRNMLSPPPVINFSIPSMRGSRKSPPAGLIPRTLSPVQDQPSPIRATPTVTPTSPSWQENTFIEQSEPIQDLPIAIPPRSSRRPSPPEFKMNNTNFFSSPTNNGLSSHNTRLTPIPSPAPSEDENEFKFEYWTLHSRPTTSASEPPATTTSASTFALQSPIYQDAIPEMPYEIMDPRPAPQPPRSAPFFQIPPENIPLPRSPTPDQNPIPLARTYNRDSSLRQQRRTSRSSIINASVGSVRYSVTAPKPLSLRNYIAYGGTMSHRREEILVAALAESSINTLSTRNQSTESNRESAIIKSPNLSPKLPQKRKDKAASKTARRSQAVMVNGPPPAPPPDCALPPLPPVGNRGSVMV